MRGVAFFNRSPVDFVYFYGTGSIAAEHSVYEVYDLQLRRQLKAAGEYCGIQLCEGVYAAMPGPTYETPAEIRFLRMIGADAVGMSTVPEAIVGRHMGMKIAGLSMLANVAAGLMGKSIDHAEVLETATQMNADVGMLLQRFFEAYES